MTYSEVELWVGKPLEMILFNLWYVGFIEVAISPTISKEREFAQCIAEA